MGRQGGFEKKTNKIKMVKQKGKSFKCYISPAQHQRIVDKAHAIGMTGNVFSQFLRKVADTKTVFLDDNTQDLLNALNLSSQNGNGS